MMSNGVDAESVGANLRAVRARIDAVERAWTHDVSITAVTKAFPAELVRVAAEAGCTSIGENYAQELLTKVDVLDALADRRPQVVFIGQLQSNKVRQLAGIVDLWASVDRRSLVDEIAKRAPDARVLIQVNSTGEERKGGCPLDEVGDLVAHAAESGLVVDGLMTVGPTGQPPEAAQPGFDAVRKLTDHLGLSVCSMGMTADVEVAVAAGSTNIRVGTALFGARATVAN